MRRIVVFIFLLPVLLCSAGVSLFAETVTIAEEGLTVYELHQLAAEDNTSIKQAARSILQTERGLESIFTLDKTSVGVSSEYGYGEPERDDSGHSLSLTTSASVPVIPQLQLGGSVHFPILGSSLDSAADNSRNPAPSSAAPTRASWARSWVWTRRAGPAAGNAASKAAISASRYSSVRCS